MDKPLALDPAYSNFFIEIKQRIENAKVRAIVSLNHQMVRLYWEVGTLITERQKITNWGDSFIMQLARDIKRDFPDAKGYSASNLKNMRQFAQAYPDLLNSQTVFGQISWSHNLKLLQGCQNYKERAWYAHEAIQNGWSVRTLNMRLSNKDFERQGKAVTNFSATLPSPLSDMAQQAFKDPYILDFISLSKDAKEKDLEEHLIKQITKFFLELGTGFAFVGNQYVLSVEEDDYRIDMLFYHLRLRCFVAVDLKMRKFEPGDAGQMNFYLSVLDDKMRHEGDNPSIGIILCKDKKKVQVEYALKNITKPIGVSQFVLGQTIPEELKPLLPSPEELEQELQKLDLSESEADL